MVIGQEQPLLVKVSESVHPSIHHLSFIHPSIIHHPSIHPSAIIHPFIHLFIHQSIHFLGLHLCAFHVVVNCGPPDLPTANSTGLIVTNTSTFLDGIATYSCSIGYNFVGSNTRVCEDGTGWSGEPPQCHCKIKLDQNIISSSSVLIFPSLLKY